MIRLAFGTVVALAGFVAFALWSVHEQPPGSRSTSNERVEEATAAVAASVEEAVVDSPTPEVAPRPEVAPTPAAVAEAPTEDSVIAADRSAPFVEGPPESDSEVDPDADQVTPEAASVVPAGRDAELTAALIRRMLAVYARTQTGR